MQKIYFEVIKDIVSEEHLPEMTIPRYGIGEKTAPTWYRNAIFDFFGFVRWRHYVEIVTKCSSINEALFYVQKAIEEGWSRNALIDCIKADLYHSAGTADTNLAEKHPGIQEKMAQEIVKDTYDLSFISLPRGFRRRWGLCLMIMLK